MGNDGNGGTSSSSSSSSLWWHSPEPYLFAGLGAMFGLIAMALMILACSYWKCSSDSEDGNGDNNGKKGGEAIRVIPVFEEKFVVIMAGDHNPSFLALPVSIKPNNYDDVDDTNTNKKCSCGISSSNDDDNENEEVLEIVVEIPKQGTTSSD
ncbi:hypothetical protein GIB67_034685 [Kingdonia uniflora]|uniref:Uncharacterized protein n=1 Tax=Kingdonia uniflora TaxID=39325 RepID=A0A7J7P0G4_9MAGN|nr:hypothetical protein GIB67_034685 [Kingdonia uniflora]